MTKRLEDAIKRLNPQQVEQLTRYAESMVPPAPRAHAPAHLSLTWVGALADAYPEHQSGVDAAHAAVRMWRESIERNLSK